MDVLSMWQLISRGESIYPLTLYIYIWVVMGFTRGFVGPGALKVSNKSESEFNHAHAQNQSGYGNRCTTIVCRSSCRASACKCCRATAHVMRASWCTPSATGWIVANTSSMVRLPHGQDEDPCHGQLAGCMSIGQFWQCAPESSSCA